LSTIQNADTVIVMDGGSIVGQGNLRDLQKSSSLVKEYVELMRID
jgi:ABC-type multidrug transport system fused ATPase/permease subunit